MTSFLVCLYDRCTLICRHCKRQSRNSRSFQVCIAGPGIGNKIRALCRRMRKLKNKNNKIEDFLNCFTFHSKVLRITTTIIFAAFLLLFSHLIPSIKCDNMRVQRSWSLNPVSILPPVSSHSYSYIYIRQLAVNSESNAIVVQSTGTYNSVDITASTYADKNDLFGATAT